MPERLSGPPGSFRPSFAVFFLVGFRLPIYLAIVSLAHALHFYRRSREREHRSLELTASLAQARLEALKMQIQPHFLFNALNAISALVHKDPEAADEMIGALSDFLRLTLESSGEQELPLRRELEFVERYLAVEKVRFGERLRFSIEAAPDTMAALVPALLLQPLVENAVRHGLEPQLRPGTLSIRAQREGDALLLSITDDGAGLPKTHPSREGIGLANTRARLRELYGDRARLELRNEKGVSVRIALPYRVVA
jgi:LytS/YehU family sensor histidine kinase